MQMKIYDFNGLKISDRNGSYGGNSGDKEGVFIAIYKQISIFSYSIPGLCRLL